MSFMIGCTIKTLAKMETRKYIPSNEMKSRIEKVVGYKKLSWPTLRKYEFQPDDLVPRICAKCRQQKMKHVNKACPYTGKKKSI